MSTEPENAMQEEQASDKKALRVIGWFSMGMADNAQEIGRAHV